MKTISNINDFEVCIPDLSFRKNFWQKFGNKTSFVVLHHIGGGEAYYLIEEMVIKSLMDIEVDSKVKDWLDSNKAFLQEEFNNYLG